MASSALRSAAGFALVAAGSLLVLLATERHAQRGAEPLAVASTAPPSVEKPAEKPAEKTRPSPLPSAAVAPPSGVAPAIAASETRSVPSPSATASASAGVPDRAGAVFHFAVGGITLTKEEVGRLVAFAAELRRETSKIVIEGFADEPGTEEKIASLGRRRAVLARQVLTDVGLDGERLTIAIGDVASDATLAGAVRIKSGRKTP